MNQRTDYNYYLSILEERSKALKGNIQGLDHNLSAYQTSLLSKDKVGNVDLGDSSNNLRTGLWSKTISLVPENQQNGGGESSKMMNRPPDTPTTIGQFPQIPFYFSSLTRRKSRQNQFLASYGSMILVNW